MVRAAGPRPAQPLSEDQQYLGARLADARSENCSPRASASSPTTGAGSVAPRSRGVPYIGTYGTERVAAAVFAGAVPPYIRKTEDNPDGWLDGATVAQLRAAARLDQTRAIELAQ